MKFKVARDKFQKALQRVGMNGGRSMLPLLSNVLIQTEENKLRISSTDLEIRLSTVLDAEIAEPGSTTLPARRLIALVGCFSASEIDIDVDANDHAHIVCGTGKFTLRGLPAADFPENPAIEAVREIKVKESELKRMIASVSYAVSADDSRKALTGVLFNLQETVMTLVATDGKRMAMQERAPESISGGNGAAIIPPQAINEAKRLLEGDGTATIALSDKMCRITGANFELTTKQIEGNYPNYRQVIPANFSQVVELPTAVLLAKIEMVSQMLPDGNNFIVLKFADNQLMLQAASSEIGEGADVMEAAYTGEPFEVSFNPRFIADALKNTDAAMVRFKLNDPLSPVAIEGGEGFLYIIMPIRKNAPCR